MKQETVLFQNRFFSLFLRALSTIPGLAVCSFAIWMSIETDIGLAPWNALAMGLANKFGVSYGTASIGISAVVLIIDLFLRERIGIGTVLNAVLIGVFVDVYSAMGISIPLGGYVSRVLALLLSLFVSALGLFLYMRPGLGCGPRDTLMVGLGRRVPRVPIGAVNIALLVAVLAVSWLLDGPIGLGTLLSACLTGVALQTVFNIVRFEPRKVAHQSFSDSFRFLCGKSA